MRTVLVRARTPKNDHFGKYGDIEGLVGYSGQPDHQVNLEIRLLQFRLRHPTHFPLSVEPVIHWATSATALAKLVCPATDSIFERIDLLQQTKGRVVSLGKPTNRIRCHNVPQFLLQLQNTRVERAPAIPAKL